MGVGKRIKRIRNLRGLTQKELGLAVGFGEKTADVRIAQYESGNRTPKEHLLRKIAEVLDVNYRAVYVPSHNTAEDVMYTLFELDEYYSIELCEILRDRGSDGLDTSVAVEFCDDALDGYMKEWRLRKKELATGKISLTDYIDWKTNWPVTAVDSSEKNKPEIQ